MDFVQRNDIRAIGFWEQDYPPLLRECPDAPVMLLAKVLTTHIAWLEWRG